jgi:dynein heavy chain
LYGEHVQAGSTIWWTWEVEDAFSSVRLGDKNAMKTFSVKLTKQLNDLVTIVRSDLNNLQRKKVHKGNTPSIL